MRDNKLDGTDVASANYNMDAWWRNIFASWSTLFGNNDAALWVQDDEKDAIHTALVDVAIVLFARKGRHDGSFGTF